MTLLELTGLAAALAASAAVAAATLAPAAPGGTAVGRPAPESPLATQDERGYDGRVTFARIQFESGGRSFGDFGRGGREPPWAHDHPRADRNFSNILGELTAIDTDADNYRAIRMDDPEVFKYPVIYVVEVGSWNPSQAEVEALGEYIAKGGFMIVDDFRDRQIYQLQAILAQAVPGMEILEVPPDHEIFDSFYYIEDPYSLIPPYGGNRPVYLGVYEDNDPAKRLLAILNYNNDIAEYWEYSDRGFYPIDLSNEAYQFGVNYFMYALTH
ncbi:DUF4159 domain-containing protein [Gaopeijia maritima]|uniref:DUF4159 domain-containing protein n=1 Tax=Gaopeijia maritima TaxID=3119007 RepID=A0ABU9E9E1_9BACT